MVKHSDLLLEHRYLAHQLGIMTGKLYQPLLCP
jgi:hypothetical protein